MNSGKVKVLLTAIDKMSQTYEIEENEMDLEDQEEILGYLYDGIDPMDAAKEYLEENK
jgi:hypothetical protein